MLRMGEILKTMQKNNDLLIRKSHYWLHLNIEKL